MQREPQLFLYTLFVVIYSNLAIKYIINPILMNNSELKQEREVIDIEMLNIAQKVTHKVDTIKV